MKRTFLFIACVLASVTMLAQEGLTVSDVQNSGCLSETRGEKTQPAPTIVLQKDGSILTVEILNYVSNCFTSYFNVKSNVTDGIGGASSTVTLDLDPVTPPIIATCECPFNVSFTVHDIEANSFYLNCWWYHGLVELTEGEQLVLEYLLNIVEVDGIYYNLISGGNVAVVINNKNAYTGDITIPESVYYEGVEYCVTSITDFYGCTNITSVTIPKSVTHIGEMAFAYCINLTTLTIGSGIKNIQDYSFFNCKNLLDVYCYAETVPTTGNYVFLGSNTGNATLHVPAASISAYQAVEPWKNFKEIVALSTQEANNPEVVDVQNSGCTNATRASTSQTFVMTKEGDIVTCEIKGIYANCGVRYFDIQQEYTKGKDAPDSLFINVTPVVPAEMDCTCPYNVSFTIRNVKSDSFYLYCFPYAGIMSFKESNQIVLELSSERVTIAGLQYNLFKPGLQAQLHMMGSLQGEVQMPSTVSYDGQDYTVSSFIPDAIGGGMAKLFIPKTIRNLGYSEFVNIINARNPSIESIEVEPGCPVLSTVDGVLYSGDRKAFYCLPAGKKLTDYSVIDGVETIGRYAFSYCPNLKTIMLPKSVTTIRSYAFTQSNNLESIYIPGKLNKDILWWAFSGMPSTVTLYVPESDIDDYKAIYKGPVLPISSSGETSEIAYRPFVEDGKVWKVGALNSGNPVQVVKYYYFEGDTIINGMTCKKMMCQQYVDPDFAESNSISQDNSLGYVGAWYEENQKVYFCDATNNQFKLMYDFSLDANATFEVDNLSYVIGPRQTGGIEGFKGVHRDVRRCESGENSYSPTWMEGVGSIDDPTKNVYYVDEAPSWCLMSCTVGDEVIYLNDEYEDGATPESLESRKHRFDFTHTVKTKPRAPASPLPPLQGARGTGTEESQLYGDYNNVLLDINLNPLYDAYLVCITNVTGKAVYEKTINAASIVALNIDISDYAEGRYTVTVENSNESFTGEIELEKHISGISDLRLNKDEEIRNTIIYNLQGQRISSLQKGLNIVNGQKVFVK